MIEDRKHFLLDQAWYIINDRSDMVNDSDITHWYLNRREIRLFKSLKGNIAP